MQMHLTVFLQVAVIFLYALRIDFDYLFGLACRPLLSPLHFYISCYTASGMNRVWLIKVFMYIALSSAILVVFARKHSFMIANVDSITKF